MLKPPLKYPGGKRRYAAQILDRLDLKPSDRYLETFLGGGAVFLAARDAGFIGCAVLNDTSLDVWRVWDALWSGEARTVIEDVLYILHYYFEATEECRVEVYERLREGTIPVHRAARVILLNRLGFNGLMRYNKSGAFNVPRGRAKGPLAGFDPDNLLAVGQALQNTAVTCTGANNWIQNMGAGDVAYLDPPYLGGFVAYTREGWGADDHRTLVSAVHGATLRGARFVVTDSGLPGVRERWEEIGMTTETLMESRAINSDGKGRGAVGCLLAYTS